MYQFQDLSFLVLQNAKIIMGAAGSLVRSSLIQSMESYTTNVRADQMDLTFTINVLTNQ